MQTSALFDTKNLGFSKFMVRSQGKREGVNFSRFCVDVRYGRPLKDFVVT